MSTASILIAFLSILLATQCSAGQSTLIPTEPTYFLDYCYTSLAGNYTTNGTYESNLITVLTSLHDHASAAPFYHTSAGSGSGEVHGQYYCRGDISPGLCSACVLQAAVAVFQNCSNVKAAVIWYDLCTLRYRNESMFGELAMGRHSYSWSLANVSDPDTFSVVLNSTLSRLINESAYGDGFNRFAVSEAAVSPFESGYFLVQCSPDVNGTECETCLWAAYDNIPRCCGMWPVRTRVFFSSCQLRYSDVLFYYTSSSTPSQMLSPPPPPPALEPTPSPPPPPPPVTATPPSTNDSAKTGSSKRVKAGFAFTTLASLIVLMENI